MTSAIVDADDGATATPVILTKVRTQDTKGSVSWLWVLTFVRMTEGGWATG